MTRLRMLSSTNHQQEADDRAAVDAALHDIQATAADPSARLPVEGLSDLSRAGAACLRANWPDLPHDVRLRVARQMLEEAEAHVERDYTRAMFVAFADVAPEVRVAALEGLWEDASSALLEQLLSEIADEPNDELRAAEAEALGRFALLAEMGDLNLALSERVRETLLTIIDSDETPTVRQRALESVGYLSGDADVVAAIDDAYHSGSQELRVSALRAMGRQADQRWVETIGREFSSREPELRFEAARSAGQNGDPRFVPGVIDLTEDEDLEVQLAAIAALGELGGRLAINALRRLSESDVPAIAEAASDALNSAYVLAGDLRPPI